MTKEEAKKRFFRFLKEKKCYSEFIRNFNECKSRTWRDNEVDIGLYDLNDYLRSTKPIDFLMNAFHWEEFGEFDTWDSRHNEWMTRIGLRDFNYE